MNLGEIQMKKLFITFLFLLYSLSANSQWIQQNELVQGGGPYSAYFINTYTGWFVNSNGSVVRTTNMGGYWDLIYNTSGAQLTCVYFTDFNTGWIAGLNGVIYKTTNSGFNWFSQSSPTTSQLNSVYFHNMNTGWIVGLSGAVEYTSNGGTNWNQINIGASVDYRAITFKNLNTGWIVGSSGYIQKTTNAGTNWFLQNFNSYHYYYSVYMQDVNTGYIGGKDSSGRPAIFITTNGGNNWSQQNTSIIPVYGQINSIVFITPLKGYASAGSYNYIIKTSNAGINWSVDTNGTFSLRTILFPHQDVAFIAGGHIWKNSFFKANLNNIYKSVGRTQSTLITLSDSLCKGNIDSVYWYVNNILVGRQHTLTYNFKQGTSRVELIITKDTGVINIDSAFANVNVGVYKKYLNGQILAGESLIGDSILYTVSTGDALYKMDINGNIIYPLVVGGNVLSACSIASDTSVYIASSDNNLYGFKSDGSNIWPPIPLGSQASTTPTIDSLSNRLYVGVANGFFKAINKTNGFGAWSYFCNAPVKSSAVISYDRKLVVASAIGTVYGFNLNNANPSPPSWTLNLNDSVLVSPAIDTSGNFYFGSQNGKIYKVALTGTNTASIVWQTPLASAVTSSPTIDINGNIYVGTADGKFYSLNKSGGIRWFFQSPAQIKSTAAITSYQRIYFGNDAGEIYGLDTNKNVQFYYIDSAKVSCVMLYNKGTLYFGNEAGRLFALYDSTGGSRGPGIPIWGTFQNNPRRTGDQSNKIPIPSVPILLSPQNGLSGLSLTPLLDWNDAPYALTFRVQLATDSLFTGLVYDTSNIYISQLIVPAGKLSFNTKYFWRVNAQNATGTSSWSGAWWFATAVSVPPPVLISPINTTIGVSLTPSLIWSSITMATSYRFQISTNSGFTSIILDSTIYSTAVNIPSGLLGNITQYYWRVASISTAGQGSFCSPWSFTTRNNLILNLKTYLEGFWNGSSMIPDTARIYIASALSPYTFLDSTVLVLSVTGTATVTFGLPPNGNYYVAIKHRNHLETWSSLTQNFITDIPVNYNFTTDSAKAYGFNMKKVGNDWVLISGDENQDGSIDAIDVSDLIIQYGNIGYLSCDFNGDGSVDAADVPYMIANYGLTKVVPVLESPVTPSAKKKIVIDKIKKEKKEQKKGKEQKINSN
jgi:photosystem II stability/assembly factor-like uncharacterized protein